MDGIIIVSGQLKSEKYEENYEMLIKAFNKKNVDLKKIYNDEVLLKIGCFDYKTDFIIFWDKDIKLCRHLENLGYLVFNSSYSIEICDDKGLTALELNKNNIIIPKQILSPKLFFKTLTDSYLKMIEKELKYPFIVKGTVGSFGKQVFIVNNFSELKQKSELFGSEGIVFQEFIKTSFGKDVRIQVVGGKVIASVKRIAKKGGLCANVSSGGIMENFYPSEKFIEVAEKVCEILKLDFAGIDMLFDKNDEPIVLEVNSNAHFKNLYDCTGINTAEYIADYIIQKVKDDKRANLL
jgi:RimK family alpha-L-glutamate ligase